MDTPCSATLLRNRSCADPRITGAEIVTVPVSPARNLAKRMIRVRTSAVATCTDLRRQRPWSLADTSTARRLITACGAERVGGGGGGPPRRAATAQIGYGLTLARARHHPLARRVGAARAAARGGDARVGVAEEVIEEIGIEVVGLAQVWRPARRRPPRRELAEQRSAAQPRRELGVGAREHRARVGDAVRMERVEVVLLGAAARRRPVPRVHARPDVHKERLARAFSAARLEHRQLRAALLRALRKMIVLS